MLHSICSALKHHDTMLHELLHASEHRYELAKKMAADIAAIKQRIFDEDDDLAAIQKQTDILAKSTAKVQSALDEVQK